MQPPLNERRTFRLTEKIKFARGFFLVREISVKEKDCGDFLQLID
jgi:hypothetical protein